jgi:hypothetical protein
MGEKRRLTDFEKHTVQLLQKVIVEHFWLLWGKRRVADLIKKESVTWIWEMKGGPGWLVRYLARGLDECVPFDSGEETAKKVRIEVGFAQSEFYVCKFEGEVISGTAFGVACEEIMGDEPDHGSGREEGRTATA